MTGRQSFAHFLRNGMAVARFLLYARGLLAKGNNTMKATNKNTRMEYGVTHTLQETADLLGITRERVRQIEKRALQKIRKALAERYGITSFSEMMWS